MRISLDTQQHYIIINDSPFKTNSFNSEYLTTHCQSQPHLLLSVCPSLHLSLSVSCSTPPSHCCHLLFALHLLFAFDWSRGAILHVVLRVRTHTHTHLWKNLPAEHLFVKCSVKSCQALQRTGKHMSKSETPRIYCTVHNNVSSHFFIFCHMNSML